MRTRRLATWLLGISILGLSAAGLCAEELNARAAVSSQDVFVGESLRFQIQVSGSEKPEEPDVSAVTGFRVRKLGGQQNSSQSISIINGRMSKVVQRGYIFNYHLTPTRAGDLVIPAVTVRAEGRTVRTQPVRIKVMKPMETDDFKLRLSLRKTRCYVGEPVTLAVTWYIGQNVQGFEFNLPVLGRDDVLHFADPEVQTRRDRQYYRIPLGSGEVIGEKGQGTLDGKEYATITFHKVLIPKKAGAVELASATVACEALIGYRKSSGRSHSFFDDFFQDDFFGRRKGVYKKVVVPSNALTLNVLALPEEERLVNFSGHVGEYGIGANAEPTEVNVGDPITLTLVLNGPEYLEHVELPPLERQEDLARDFKIPSERAAGKTAGRTKIFTQTIRPKRADIKEIPSIELPYFDTARGKYMIARTKPIPLTVRTTRILTAEDAEGRELHGVASRALEAWTRGIAANYEDLGVLEDQRCGPEAWLESPAWLCVIGIPPVAYGILLLTVVLVRRKGTDPLTSRSRKAYGTLSKKLAGVDRGTDSQEWEAVLDALRRYLADRLRLPVGALTFEDVRARLGGGNLDAETLAALKSVFERCEAGRYAGNAAGSSLKDMIAEIKAVAGKLERVLK